MRPCLMSLTADSDRPIWRAISVRLMPDRSMLEMQRAQFMRNSLRYAVDCCNGYPLRHSVIMLIMTTPGDIIKKRRDALGLTQTALSKKAKVHLNTLRDIEAKGGAKSSFLPQLARALAIDIYALVNGELSTAEERPSNAESGAAGSDGKPEAARAMALVDEVIGTEEKILEGDN